MRMGHCRHCARGAAPRLASRKKLLGGREWYVQQEDPRPWPHSDRPCAWRWVVVRAERFLCSARVTTLASAFDDSIVVAGGAVGGVYVSGIWGQYPGERHEGVLPVS